MEEIRIELSCEKYDRLVHKGLRDAAPSVPQAGPLHVVFKPAAMISGAGGVVIAFEIEVSPGKRVTAQAVTSAACFLGACGAAIGYQEGGHLDSVDRN